MNSEEFNQIAPDFYEILLDSLYTYKNELTKVIPTNGYIKQYNDDYCILIEIPIDDRCITFTVTFHPIYLVPVCHFKETLGEPIQVTQTIQFEQHPIFQDVWKTIHPCETNKTMEDFGAASTLGYLITWFNLYGIPCIYSDISMRDYGS